jgi:formimidoylglutamate deiminase
MTRLFFEAALLPQGWARDVRIAIVDGMIAALDTDVEPDAGDERHRIALAGLPNLHSHGFQRGMAGLAETRGPAADSFWTWREVMYRFLGRMNPEDVEAITAQAYVEMLEAGFTRVGEFHYLHNDISGLPYANPAELGERIVSAAAATGINLTLLPVFYAHANFGGEAPAPGQRRFINDVDGFARLLEASRHAIMQQAGASLGVAPHSLRAVTPDQLAAVSALAGQGPVHIHVAEQTKEVDDCFAWSGRRPVEWLLDNADVNQRWCLIHATHTTTDERRRITERGATTGLCPITEANLGDGIVDAPALLHCGGAFGIGTDSNVCIGAAEELRQLEYAQRLTKRARNVLATEETPSTGRALFDAALKGGSRALGVGPAGLIEGAPADIVSLDANHIALTGHSGDGILDAWIFCGGRSLVDCVWTRGRQVVTNGRHQNAEAIAERFRQSLAGLIT